jgi:hypothetical protein
VRVVTWVLIRMGVAAAASQLGWSDKTKALVLLGLLVVALLVVAARRAARDQSGGSRPQVRWADRRRSPWAQESGSATADPSPSRPSRSRSRHPNRPSPPSLSP